MKKSGRPLERPWLNSWKSNNKLDPVWFKKEVDKIKQEHIRRRSVGNG